MATSFKQQANQTWRQIILVFAAAASAMFFLTFKVYEKFNLYFDALFHKVTAACGCTEITQFISMHPLIFGLIITFGAGLLLFAVYAAYKIIRLFLQTKKFIKHYLSFAKQRPSAKLRSIIKSLNFDHNKFIEINSVEPTVFCFGFRQPKICVSRALINILTGDELKAVLCHEYQHLLSREPLKYFIAKYFQNVFFFLPAIKTLVRKYLTLSELAADAFAGHDSIAKANLAGAILKISQQNERQTIGKNLALSFFSPIIAERVNSLSDNNYTPKFKFFGRGLIAFALSLSLAASLFLLFLIDSAKAFEMHNINTCKSTNNSLVCSSMNNQNMSYASQADCEQTNACKPN